MRTAAAWMLIAARSVLRVPAMHARQADRAGRTPLHWAAVVGSVPCAELLVEAGAALERPTAGAGATPLHMAADSGHAPFVAFMLERGADHEAKDLGGLRPVDLAKNGNYAEAVAALPADPAPPGSACACVLL